MPSAHEPPPRPAPPLPAVPNLRDAGGLPAAGGARVRTGVLYRSGQLDALAGDALAAFSALDVGTVVDLRTARERDRSPDRLPPGVRLVVADVLGDHGGSVAASLPRMLREPALVEQAVAGGHVHALFERTYREFVTLPSARTAYARLYRAIADDAGGRPLLFHCTAGKDRTGWASAALLLLVGVERDAVMADFLLSDELARASFAPLVEAFAAAGGDPDHLRPILGVEPRYLEAGLAELDRAGGAEAWFDGALGLGPDVRARLRERLLER